MDTNNTLTFAALVVGVLSWVVFVPGMYKISRIYLEICSVNRELSINLTGINSDFKNLATTVNEINIEPRRTNKLLIETIDRFEPPDEEDEGNGTHSVVR